MALALAIGWGSAIAYERATRQTQILGETSCPFMGQPQVMIAVNLAPEDTAPVRAHEEVHAAQCRALGPFRYRWANLGSESRLDMEAPAYCAGAAARIRAGESRDRVRQRMIDDVTESMKGIADSVSVQVALTATCPGIVRR